MLPDSRASIARSPRLGSRAQAVMALAVFLALSFAYFGLAVAAHPGRYLIGTGADPGLLVWLFAWFPHALLHWQNPIVTHVVWAPDGVDLAWTTPVPALTLALAPLTLLAGPAVAYNVAAVLLPALAAWTAFLLCRHLTHRFLPSLVGGYLFGFSSYMLGQEEGHLHMTAVFLVPLAALLVLRFVQGELRSRRLTGWLGLLLAVQILLSTELLFTLTLALAAGILIVFAAVPELRARLRSLLRPLAGAYALAAILASPFLYYVLSDFQSKSINLPANSPADLLNFVIPTGLVALSHNWGLTGPPRHFGSDAEAGAYLGIPLLVIVVLYAWRSRRSPAGRALVISLAVAMFVALGTALHVNGHRVVALPWELIARLPGFDNVLPVRFSLYASLAAAVIVALWSSSGERLWLRVLLPALAVLTVVPHFGVVPYLGHSYWKTTPDRPPFFSKSIYRTCLRPNENLLVFPYGPRGDSMLWQAEAGFRFRMAGGYIVTSPPDSFLVYPGFGQIRDGILPYAGISAVNQLARAKGITTILVARSPGDPEVALWNGFLAKHFRPVRVGGVTLYRLTPGPSRSPACVASRG